MLMGSAIGGGSESRSSVGLFWVDVRDYGAKPANGFDCSAAFQAAVDSLAARITARLVVDPSFRTVGTVFIPADTQTYYLSLPVWVDSPFIEIRGEGQGTQIAMMPGVCHPLFIFGLRRAGQLQYNSQTVNLAADSRYRPDLFGKLDATAVPAVGQRWGYRSRGDSLIQSQASPLSAGSQSLDGSYGADHFAETTGLTIEFAVEGPSGGVMPSGLPIAGLGVATKGQTYPFVLYTGADNRYTILFCTQAARFGPSVTRRLDFSSGSLTGVQKIAIQIDLVNAAVSAYVNGVQVATTNSLQADWAPGLHFTENDYFPMLIGNMGGDRPSLGSLTGFDFNLYGFLLSRTVRYLSNGVGQPQTRADAPTATVTDRYRYFTPRYGSESDPGMIGYLTFAENPSNLGRLLSVQGGPAAQNQVGSAFLIHCLQTNPGGIAENGIHDIHLIGGHIYGQNIMVAQVLEMKISGVRSSDSYHGIGSLSLGANYLVRVDDCVLDSSESGYFALDQGLWMRNVYFVSSGRATMRFVGSFVDAQNLFIAFHSNNSQSSIKIHASDYGGNYAFRNMNVDYEGDTFAHTAIYCEAHPYASATSLRLQDIYLGTVGRAAILTLKDHEPFFSTSILVVDNLQANTGDFIAALDLDGPGWYGEIKNLVGIGQSPRIIHRAKYGDVANVVIREAKFKAPPRSSNWHAGAHVLDVPAPSDGQYSEWRCVSGGTYGTAVPPNWAGLSPLNVGLGSLAGYVLNQGYISAALS